MRIEFEDASIERLRAAADLEATRIQLGQSVSVYISFYLLDDLLDDLLDGGINLPIKGFYMDISISMLMY